MRLKNVIDFNTNEELGKNCIFYPNKIRSIKILDEGPERNYDQTLLQDEEEVVHKPEVAKSDIIQMTKTTMKRVYEAGNNIVYIKAFDHCYYKAIEDISRQLVIGLNIEHVDFGRMSKTPAFLSIATLQAVYLFDLVKMKKIGLELKEILQGKEIEKVVHFSKYMVDWLRHCPDSIKLNHYFDTMMAYMSATKTKEVLRIDQLVLAVFNIDIELQENISWLRRPMSSELEHFASLKVMFLLELQRTLLRDHLVRPFYKASQKAMNELSKRLEVPFVAKQLVGNAVEDITFEELTFDLPKKYNEAKKTSEKREKSAE